MATEQDSGVLALEGVMVALAAQVGVGGQYNGAKLRLYKSTFTPGRASVAADFIAHEADFTGYPAGGIALTWGTPGVDTNADPVALSNRVQFQPTDAVAPNTVNGCWINQHVTGPPATDTVVEYYQFAQPIPLVVALAVLGVVIAAYNPGSAGYAMVDF